MVIMCYNYWCSCVFLFNWFYDFSYFAVMNMLMMIYDIWWMSLLWLVFNLLQIYKICMYANCLWCIYDMALSYVCIHVIDAHVQCRMCCLGHGITCSQVKKMVMLSGWLKYVGLPTILKDPFIISSYCKNFVINFFLSLFFCFKKK